MAGDWIKMRLDLQTHPKVVRILSATKSDKFRVIGGLHAVWSVFDTHSSDGRLDGYTAETLDHIIGWEGFSGAMIAVGWLIVDGQETLVLPEFDEHNGKSGKRRAEDQKRKRNDRKCPQSVRNPSEENADEKLTREEKRREEVNTPPNPPSPPGDEGKDRQQKRERKQRISLKTFVDRCMHAGEKPISEYRPLLEYVETTGLPMDFVQLCWEVFKDEFLPGGDKAGRLQADWRRHLLTYVKKGYYRLWYAKPDGSFELTTAGIQAKTYHAKKSA